MSTCWFLAGLGFGDEGKGSCTDALIRHTGADLIVKYNGTAQCAHNVSLPDGRHHTFSQFGSGSFVSGVKTFLSRFVLINPLSMMIEAESLAKQGVTDIWSRTYIDRRAIVITPFQRSLNRLQELSRGDNRHGSTGMGIGVAREHSFSHPEATLYAEDLGYPYVARRKLELSRDICREEVLALEYDTSKGQEVGRREKEVISLKSTVDWYLEKYADWCQKMNGIVDEPPFRNNGIIFEGAQGVLLDEKWGFQPNTTWTDITFTNAETILREMDYTEPIHKIGVLRSYYTRHGAGYFPSEDTSGWMKSVLAEEHNKGEEYTGEFRVGRFDLPMAQYALRAIGGVDSLAINHLDVAARLGYVSMRLSKDIDLTIEDRHFLPMLEENLQIPISIKGYGPTYADKEISEIIQKGNAQTQAVHA